MVDIESLQTDKNKRRKSILLIDDDRSVRVAISQALQKTEYELIEAGSSAAAAKIWADQREAIDLILVDVLLPGLSGPELANEILEQSPAAAIIFMTGVGQENLVKFHLPSNARVLLKPFTLSVLRETIASALFELSA